MKDNLEMLIPLGMIFGAAIGSIAGSVGIGAGIGLFAGAVACIIFEKNDELSNQDGPSHQTDKDQETEL